jgi:hypothetical protein
MAAPPKPKVKPKPKAGAALGSAVSSQLPGQWCVFNKNYTLGKSEPINFEIKSAEYRFERIKVADHYRYPNLGRKLLVIHGTAQNSMKTERWFNSGTIHFTAVDGDSQNTDAEYICLEANGVQVDLTMKPAQKLDVYVIFDVTGKGEIPKLMAASYSDTEVPVARYDLRGKVKGMVAPYADPSDKTGATVNSQIMGVIGKSAPVGEYDIKVESVTFSNKSFGEDELPEGTISCVVTYELNAFCEQPAPFGDGNLIYEDTIIDTDGQSYDVFARCISATTDRHVQLDLTNGKTYKYRAVYQITKGVQLKELKIVQGEATPLIIDLSAYKAQ